MKKSKTIHLVLMGSLLASCHSKEQPKEDRLYLRTDTTSSYTHHHYGGFVHFSPYYNWHPFYGQSVGYDSRSISPRTSSYSHVTRGGFGSSGFHTSS
jgi:uncharacterized protein YgiB involved in biofilm formation